VKLPVYTIRQHSKKAYGRVVVQLTVFLISKADAGGFQLHTWKPLAWGKSSGTLKIAGRVGPRASLDGVVKRKIPQAYT
jgi:hypothetical protein